MRGIKRYIVRNKIWIAAGLALTWVFVKMVYGRMAVHILCPDSDVRMKMAAAISNRMSLDGEIIMLDDSTMFIKKLQVNYKSDYLKDGQVFVTGRYGLLRYRAKHKPLNVANMNCEEGGRAWQEKA